MRAEIEAVDGTLAVGLARANGTGSQQSTTPNDGEIMRETTNAVRFVKTTALALATLFYGATALAANPPATADVLTKLHQSNQKEIEMGKTAQKNGKSKDVTNFGKMLVKDHSAADKKVMALAKQEKIDLPPGTPPAKDDMADMAKGADFDTHFAQSMLEDHKKDIADATSARDATTDEQLKKLLTGMLPTLQKHQDTAQKIVDGSKKP
jgi:putative membrane protein